MGLSKYLRDFKELKGKMLEEGVINETFLNLEGIDKDDPNFAFEIIDLFLVDAEQILSEINKVVDMRKINLFSADAHMHQLKGCTGGLGVRRLKILTEAFRTFYLQGSANGCLRTVREINQEYVFCKDRLTSFKNLAEKIRAAGGVLPRTGASF